MPMKELAQQTSPAEQLPEERKRAQVKLEVVKNHPADALEAIKEKFKPVLDAREGQYDRDVEANPKMEAMRGNLETHNEIVLGYAAELVQELGLEGADKVAAVIATIHHDSGKLAAGLLEHHAQGAAYAAQLMDQMMGQEFDGVKVTREIKQKVMEAIERHMNHPFLVGLNKGQRFPEPVDDVDRVVFDADMMANAGFKNVAFRLVNEQFLTTDAQAAAGLGITTLEASFINVMQGVSGLPETVLSAPAKQTTKTLVEAVRQIYTAFKQNNTFAEIQGLFSGPDGEFTRDSINQNGGFALIKKVINEKILITGNRLGLDQKYLRNFQM